MVLNWEIAQRQGHDPVPARRDDFGAQFGSLAYASTAWLRDGFGVSDERVVEDRIGQRGIADVVVPVADRQLARHDASVGAGAIIKQFEQVVAFAGPIVVMAKSSIKRTLIPGYRSKSPAEAVIGVEQIGFPEQARCMHMQLH